MKDNKGRPFTRFQTKVLILLIALLCVPGLVGIFFTFWVGYRHDVEKSKELDKKLAWLAANHLTNKLQGYTSYLLEVVRENRGLSLQMPNSEKAGGIAIAKILYIDYITKNFPFVNNVIIANDDLSRYYFKNPLSNSVLDYLRSSSIFHENVYGANIIPSPIQLIDNQFQMLLVLPFNLSFESRSSGTYQFNYLISLVNIKELLQTDFHYLLKNPQNRRVCIKDHTGNNFYFDFASEVSPQQNIIQKCLAKINSLKLHNFTPHSEVLIEEKMDFSEINIGIAKPWRCAIQTDTDNLFINSMISTYEITRWGVVSALILGIGAVLFFGKQLIVPINRLKEILDDSLESDQVDVVSKFSKDCVIFPLAERIASLIQTNKAKIKIEDFAKFLEEEVKNKTKEITQTNEYYKQILDKLDVGILVVDSETFEIIFYNEYMNKNKFCPRSDKKKCHQVIFGIDHHCTNCSGRRSLCSENPIKSEAKDKDGKQFEINHSKLVHNDKLYIIELFYNISTLRENELERLLSVAHEAAHEIKNPLQIIHSKMSNVSTMLKEQVDTECVLTKLGEIFVQVERIDFLVGQMRAKKDIEIIEANLVEIIYSSLKNIAYSLPHIKVTTTCNLQENDRLMSFVDTPRMQSVFENLFKNAYHALEGIVDASLDVQLLTEPGNVIINITDNGTGIKPEFRSKIFDPFFTTKEPGKGSGVGLSICYKSVKEHGGEIFLAEGNGCGTRFTIKLPKQPKL